MLRKYGGFTEGVKTEVEDSYEYEFQGGYKYISVKYLNEIMDRADEYQSMFEEYFKV